MKRINARSHRNDGLLAEMRRYPDDRTHNQATLHMRGATVYSLAARLPCNYRFARFRSPTAANRPRDSEMVRALRHRHVRGAWGQAFLNAVEGFARPFAYRRPIMRAAKEWIIVSVAAWTAFAVLIRAWVIVEHVYEGLPPPPVSDYAMQFVEMYSLGLLTPVLIYVAHVFPPSRRPTIVTVAVYIATLTAVCIAGVPLMVFLANTFANAQFTTKTALGEAIFTFLTYTVVFTLILTISQMRLANERLGRALRLEADLTRMRVEALQRQLHPHFIFNTLNAIGAIMQNDVAVAEEMISALAALLRTATDKSNPLVPLRDELSILDRYAFIMKLRYGSRLKVTISAEPRALEILVPAFTLQPLAENAIVHGLEKSAAGITIDVSCRLENDKLCIDINDDGAAPDMLTFQEGVGIGNTRARLAELYGRSARLSIAPRDPLGTHLSLAIPTVAPTL